MYRKLKSKDTQTTFIISTIINEITLFTEHFVYTLSRFIPLHPVSQADAGIEVARFLFLSTYLFSCIIVFIVAGIGATAMLAWHRIKYFNIGLRFYANKVKI